MRMEELKDNHFIKETDTVEKYLLSLVQQYFNEAEKIPSSTPELIIQRAVERMKRELDIDNAGVTSFNGMTGDINITAESLGAEPFIADKKTAFNKDFGDSAGTVCEGNDPRLSDMRHPLPHKHPMSDITGLAGAIASVQASINMLNGTGHSHPNKTALDRITYSGSSDTIDLDILDSVKREIENKIREADKKIRYYSGKLDELIKKAGA